MAKKTKVVTLKGERFLQILIGLFIAFNILGQSFSMAMLSKTNIELEDVKDKITEQNNINKSLEMKINELASLDNIRNVAYSFGLEYNNNNIRIVND